MQKGVRGLSGDTRGSAAASPESQPAGADRSADIALRDRLRAGDEAAFAEIVDRWSPAMLRIARSHLGDAHAAEDVVQDAWLGMLRGLDTYAARSSLRSWVFGIVANVAKTRAVRDRRTLPVPDLANDSGAPGPTVAGSRFRGAGDPHPGHWTTVGRPQAWPEPVASLLDRELRQVIEATLLRLPSRQRAVVSLRDVHQLTAEETCAALDISGANQRVLLHRGRAAVRAAIETYYATA